MRHTISILVENEFGVLSRVAGLFSGRGFNIESLSVAETLDPTASRIALVTTGDDAIVEQITNQLNKLVSIIRVSDFKDTEHVERELVLVKVTADEHTRAELMNIVSIFRGKDADPAKGIPIMHYGAPPAAAGDAFQRMHEAGVDDGHQTRLLFAAGGISLVYVWFKSGYPLPRHTHDSDCLYYVIGGSLKLGTEELGQQCPLTGASTENALAVIVHSEAAFRVVSAEMPAAYLPLCVCAPPPPACG